MSILPAIQTGLCSVTFRQLASTAIVSMAQDAGIEAIEWGADIHLPPGDLKNARAIRLACSDSGIATPTVGSYIRCVETSSSDFLSVLETSQELGATSIRIWAGTQGSAETQTSQRAEITATINSYCDLAADQGVELALEYHQNTLTDTLDSTLQLLRDVDHVSLSTYWQPRKAGPVGDALIELDALKDHLHNVHVFHWESYAERHALADGSQYWAAVFAHLFALPKPKKLNGRFAFLEFVKNDDPAQFRRDAATLKEILASIHAEIGVETN